MNEDLKALELEMGKINPSFSLSENNLKDIKDWKVGKKYEVDVTIKMTSKMEEYGMPTEAYFEILSVKTDDYEKSEDDVSRIVGGSKDVSFLSETI